MDNKFHRAIEHLTKTSDSSSVLSAFQKVEDLFNEEWLNKKEDHRLQKLWARRDYLSSSELYSFGKAMIKLSKDNRTWLESTVKEIKKNIHSSHGLITEIIIIGSLSTEKGVITPCSKSFPIYDYTVDYDSGYKYKVSIKNFDISVHEKKYNDMCEIIRKTFQNFLNRRNMSGVLQIVFEESLITKETLEYICCFIVFEMNEHRNYRFSNPNFMINFLRVDGYDDMCSQHSSDIVLIWAKQHPNEQRNIESKIKSANNSMLKDTIEPHSIKKLILRLGETTNFNRVKKYIKNIAEDYENCGFDMCLIFQPMVVSDIVNKSTSITTTFCPIAKSFSLLSENTNEKLKHISMLNFELGIGSLNTQHVPLKLMDGDSTMNIDFSEYYTYQKGDIYIQMKSDGESYYGELMQTAPGVTVHAVFQKMIIQPIVFPNNNKLLIV